MINRIKEFYKLHPLLIGSILLGGLTMALYAPVAGFSFINLDDPSYVVDNPLVRYGIEPENVFGAFAAYISSNWHPVTWLSHMLDVELFGMNAGAHHLVNALIHTANTVLLFIILRQMTGALWKSLLVAALFAWHPLHVESVAWVSERKDILCAFFWLLTIWAYIRYIHKNSNGFFLLSLLFGVLAMMAKPMAVTLPFVLLLLDIGPLKRLAVPDEKPLGQRIRLLLVEKLPLLLFVVFTCYQTCRAQSAGESIKSLESLPIWHRLTNTSIAYVSYLRMMVWPTDLAIFYPHPHQLRIGLAIVCGFILIMITVLAVLMRKKQMFLIFGWLWYLGTLIPVIGLVQVGGQSLADRYTYLPLVGIFIMVAWFIGDMVQHRPRLKPVVVGLTCIILIACSALTRLQIYHWKDSQTLLTHTLSVTDTGSNWLAHAAMGSYSFMLEKYPQAKEHFDQATAIKPDYEFSQYMQARTLGKLGQPDEAIVQFQETLQAWPECVEARYYLGQLYETQNQLQNALAQYRKAHQIKPQLHQPVTQIVWILSTCPDPQIRDGKQALNLIVKFMDSPHRKNPIYLCALAAAYAETEQFDKAAQTAQKALHEAVVEDNPELVKIITECITSYERQLPYRQKCAGPLPEKMFF